MFNNYTKKSLFYDYIWTLELRQIHDLKQRAARTGKRNVETPQRKEVKE